MELSTSNIEIFQRTKNREKNSLYFEKWNFLALILKNFKKRKPRKKNPYISGN